MILYNFTFIVEDGIVTEWKKWIKEDFIAPVMASGIFQSNNFLKVLFSPNEGTTFCIQFTTESITTAEGFKEHEEPNFLRIHASQFNNKALCFTSLMETIA